MIIDAVNAIRSPSVKGCEISSGKNCLPVMFAAFVRRQLRQRLLADELLHRVVAEERGEQAPDRRLVRDPLGGRRRDPVALESIAQRRRQRAREPHDHEAEEQSDRQDHARCSGTSLASPKPRRADSPAPSS